MERVAERIPGYCTLCRSRCGTITVVEGERLLAVEPHTTHPTGGALCAKGRAAPELVHSPRRLTVPLRRTSPRGAAEPRWEEISWDVALDAVADRLSDIRETSGAEAVAFAITTPSGTPMVDSFDWVERFVRCFGSPNVIYAVEVCGWHKDYAHALTFGRGIGVPDYEQADAIVLWGHNPARTWLAQASRIADARRRGATVAVVDPKPNGSGQLADQWLRIRPGADGALAMGAIHHLIASGTFDAAFVARWTNAPLLVDTATGALLRADALWADGDPDAFVLLDAAGTPRPYDTRRPPPEAAAVRLDGTAALTAADGHPVAAATVFHLLAAQAAPYTLAHVAAITWLEPEAVAAFYALFENSPRLAYHSWTGVGQHTNATATERAIATLYALTGACDRPGGNLWTVPPPTQSLNDYALLPPAQQAKALGLAELPLGPPRFGWITARDFAQAVLDGTPYPVRALMSFGTNFAVSQGDTARNLRALQALAFHVHVDMFMNPTAENADIVLPANMPWERDALKIGFEITQAAAETIQFRPRVLPPLGESRADYDIAAALALRLGHGEAFFGGDIEAGWNFQLAPLGLTVDDLRRQPDGVRCPQPTGFAKYAAVSADGSVAGFATPTRRVELYSDALRAHGHAPLPGHVEPTDSPQREADPPFPLVLTTAKSGWFVHSSHRHVAALRKKSPDPAVEIAPALATARGLSAGDWAVLETVHGAARLRVRLNPALDARVVLAEFGWWEDCPPLGRDGRPPAGALTSNINAVLSDQDRDPVSGSVPLRAGLCQIRRDATASRGFWTGTRAFRVAERRAEGDEVLALRLEPVDGGALPAVLPGQYVMATPPGASQARAYSLTEAGPAPDTLTLGVKRHAGRAPEAHGTSDRMHALKIGDVVQLEAPAGLFTPPLAGARPLLFLAAGVGITPFLAHLEALAQRGPAARVPKVLLLHACRDGAAHPFATRLAALEAALPELERITVYSAPRPEDRLTPGRVEAGRLDLTPVRALLAQRPLAYLCGSPAFTAAMTEALSALGLHRFDIFAEAFADPPAVPATLAPQTIQIAGTGDSFAWSPQNGSLLEAAHAAGIALPSGCRVGQCESCALTLVSGAVAHLDGSTPEPGACLTCQAVPLSPVTLAL